MALVVVPNPLLMDNHQAELGEHLAKQRVLVGGRAGGCTQASPAPAGWPNRALEKRVDNMQRPPPHAHAHKTPCLIGCCACTQACASPEELTEVVRRLDVSSLVAFSKGSSAGIVAAIGGLMGVAQHGD